jgi:phosphate transport system protein
MTAHFVELLDGLMQRSLRMARTVEHMVAEVCAATAAVDAEVAGRLILQDEEIDQEEVAIEAETLRLMTLFQPMGVDMRRLCTILKVNGDLERIADCVVNIAERVEHLDRQAMEPYNADLKQIYPAVRRMLHDVLHAYSMVDQSVALRLRSEDDVIDAFYGQFIRKLVSEAARSPESLASHLDVLSIAKNLERIADHITNIAEDVIYLATGRIVRHSLKS